MTNKNILQNNINRNNGYIDYVKNSAHYSDAEKEIKIKKAKEEIEQFQLELLKEIEVDSKTITP